MEVSKQVSLNKGRGPEGSTDGEAERSDDGP